MYIKYVLQDQFFFRNFAFSLKIKQSLYLYQLWVCFFAKLIFNFNFNLVDRWDAYILTWSSHPPIQLSGQVQQ